MARRWRLEGVIMFGKLGFRSPRRELEVVFLSSLRVDSFVFEPQDNTVRVTQLTTDFFTYEPRDATNRLSALTLDVFVFNNPTN